MGGRERRTARKPIPTAQERSSTPGWRLLRKATRPSWPDPLEAGMELIGRLFGAPSPKRYRIACLYEEAPNLERPFWRQWPQLFDAADALIRVLPDAAYFKSIQYDPEVTRHNDCGGTVTRFRKLAWSEA